MKPTKAHSDVCLCQVCCGPLRLVHQKGNYWVGVCTKCGVLHQGDF